MLSNSRGKYKNKESDETIEGHAREIEPDLTIAELKNKSRVLLSMNKVKEIV